MTTKPLRRVAPALVALAAVLAGAVPVQAAQAGAVPVLVVDGQGFGHGVGMAQEGASTMGVAGSSTAEILGQFYPGTTIGQAAGQVRVPVLSSAAGTASLSFPSGGEIRSAPSGPQAAGFPIVVGAGDVVTLRYDGSLRASVAPSGTVVAQKEGEPTIVEPPGPTQWRPPEPAPPEAPGPTPAVPPPAEPSPAPVPAAPPSPPVPVVPPPPTVPAAPPAPAIPPSAATPVPVPSGPGSTSDQPGPGPQAVPGPLGPAPADASGDTPEVWSPPTASGPSVLYAVPAAGSTVALAERSARYRGLVEASAGGGALKLVNRLDVEDYLRGMGEVRDPSWPPASLQAQAVAARTYALRAMAAGNEICASQRCQVYLGQQAEYAAMDAAVAATRGQVLRYGTELATAVYSADGGGVSATPTEGFGPAATDLPYLRSAPYPTGDPDHWQVRIGLADLAARLGYPSTLESVRVSAVGPSGRATAVELSGGAGARTIAARSLGQALGLRSTLWSLSLSSADVAPPPPPAADLVQVPPAEAAIAPLAVPPAAPPGRALDQPAPIATTASPANTGAPLWLLYAVIFLATASRRRIRRLEA